MPKRTMNKVARIPTFVRLSVIAKAKTMETSRKIGIGTYLMAILAQISLENDCKSLKWQCLDTNTKGLKFYYEKLKATEEVMETNGKQSKLVNIEMDEEDMKNLSLQVLK